MRMHVTQVLCLSITFWCFADAVKGGNGKGVGGGAGGGGNGKGLGGGAGGGGNGKGKKSGTENSYHGVWKTVLLSETESKKNIFRQLYKRKGVVPPTAAGSNLSHVFELANGRDEFKSKLIDTWSTENHTDVRLAVFNKHGDVIWYATFDGFGSDEANWYRSSRVEESSDPTLLQTDKWEIVFDDVGLNVTRTDVSDSGWLWVDYEGGTIRILLSTSGSRPFPSGFVPDTNAILIAGLSKPTHTFTFNENFFRYGTKASSIFYMLGFSVKKQPSGYLTEFSMEYSAEPDCLAVYPEGHISYKADNGSDRVFVPVYDINDLAVFPDVTFRAQCLWITKLKGQGTVSLVLNVFATPEDYIEGAMVGIQWAVEEEENSLESRIDEIQQQLAVNKYETAQYRSQLTSAVDNRGSAVAIAVGGILIFLLIIVGIILLDIATLTKQVKFMKSNLRRFRKSVHRFKASHPNLFPNFPPRFLDVKDIKVKVTSGSGSAPKVQSTNNSAGTVLKVEDGQMKVQSAQKSATTVVKVEEGNSKSANNGTDKATAQKSKLKSSIKSVTDKKTPASLSKISE